MNGDAPSAQWIHIPAGCATLGVARNTPDYPQVQVMNTIFGGLFSSRINLNLREAHAYTYGAFSSFSANRTPGPPA